jgi:hypothetical protein
MELPLHENSGFDTIANKKLYQLGSPLVGKLDKLDKVD